MLISISLSGTRPHFESVDEVVFRRAVNVGALLQFESKVIFTEPEREKVGGGAGSGSGAVLAPTVHVHVSAYITTPEARSSELSNEFFFTFYCDEGQGQQEGREGLRHVIPSTETEARLQLTAIDDHADPE